MATSVTGQQSRPIYSNQANQKLSDIIFTPSTKPEFGHDVSIESGRTCDTRRNHS